MSAKKTVLILLTPLLLLPITSEAQEKPKHTVLDGMADIGPTAKRQAGYMLDEVTQFFTRVHNVMTSEDTTKAHMENAYSRATNRSIENWNERQQKVMGFYVSWARQKGTRQTKLPSDWSTYFNRIQAFLSDMADGRGFQAAVWKRELNTANKRFVKFAKLTPKAMALYLRDVGEADKELAAAEETLELAAAKLDDLKRHARHLRKIRNLIKNLSRYMVQQQERGKEIMEDKALKPDTFQKGLDVILTWKTECEADSDMSSTCKQVPTYWHKYGKEALDKYRKNYTKVSEAVADFLEGSIFEGSDYFHEIDYDGLVYPVDKLLEEVRIRIKGIQDR